MTAAEPSLAQVPHQSQLLRLLHLASPALPIGAFHFSQGLEYAVEVRSVSDEKSALGWIGGLLEGSLQTLDLPILSRLHQGWVQDDLENVLSWNASLIAMRETAEARAEDLHMGTALSKVLADLDIEVPQVERFAGRISYAAAFSLACSRWQVSPLDTLQAYAWAWAETQVIAAIKLVPLGQRAGQRILHALIPTLQSAASRALTVTDDEIGIGGVMQAFASARHETQYTRLFRS
jgi:urease accessory protein